MLFYFIFLATEHASSMPFKKTSMVDDKTTVGHLLQSPQFKSCQAHQHLCSQVLLIRTQFLQMSEAIYTASV